MLLHQVERGLTTLNLPVQQKRKSNKCPVFEMCRWTFRLTVIKSRVEPKSPCHNFDTTNWIRASRRADLNQHSHLRMFVTEYRFIHVFPTRRQVPHSFYFLMYFYIYSALTRNEKKIIILTSVTSTFFFVVVKCCSSARIKLNILTGTQTSTTLNEDWA